MWYFLPYPLGERTPVWDPGIRGAWVGMSVGTGRHDHAVLESAGYGMRQMLEIEETQRGSEVGEVFRECDRDLERLRWRTR